MQFTTKINQKLPFFVALSLLMAVLTSCGSYQYAGYDNDGIYGGSDNDIVTDNVEQPEATTSTNDSNYYKNYFAENSAEIDAINGENEIFTDADSYQDDYTVQDSLEQRQPYGGWGQNNNNVTINVIDNGWYGWNQPFFWNAGYGFGFRPWIQPWGWDSWGWNSRWGYGWNATWGYGGWNNWGWNAGLGYAGWNNWCWNNGYYRNSNRYAFSNSRRGSLLYNNNLSRNTRSNSAISRSDYSTRRLSNSVNSSNSRSSRLRSNTSTIRNNRSSRSTSTIRNSSSTRRSSGTMRSSGSTRSSGTMRSSGSTSRSSGTMRSGSSSSRSSGGSVRSSGSSRSSSGSRGSSGGGRRGG